MIYCILIANCLAMVLGFYLVWDKQFITGIVCFLISFIGFRQLCIELDKPKKKRKKKLKQKVVKPKQKMSIESQIRLDKFSMN
jgi:hypothetical protein